MSAVPAFSAAEGGILRNRLGPSKSSWHSRSRERSSWFAPQLSPLLGAHVYKPSGSYLAFRESRCYLDLNTHGEAAPVEMRDSMHEASAAKTPAPLNVHSIAFPAITCFFIFAASTVPTLYYSGYKASFGLSDAQISIAMATYLLGVLGVLFFAGSLSDALGRKPLAAASIVLAFAGCATFAFVESATMLYAARFLQGLSCGIAMSAVSSWIIDLARPLFPALGTTLASTGALIGITIGSLLVGIVSNATPNPLVAYAITCAMLLVCLPLLALAPETVQGETSLGRALKPSFGIGHTLLPFFVLACFAYSAAWCATSYFQAFCAPVASDVFGMAAPVAASAILALAMAPSAAGGPVEARLSSKLSLRVAATALLATLCACLASMALGNFPLCLVTLVAMSLASGMGLSGSLRMLLSRADASQTATVVSALNLIAYVACTAFSFINGAIAAASNLLGVMAFAIFVAAVSAAVIFLQTHVYLNKER